MADGNSTDPKWVTPRSMVLAKAMANLTEYEIVAALRKEAGQCLERSRRMPDLRRRADALCAAAQAILDEVLP